MSFGKMARKTEQFCSNSSSRRDSDCKNDHGKHARHDDKHDKHDRYDKYDKNDKCDRHDKHDRNDRHDHKHDSKCEKFDKPHHSHFGRDDHKNHERDCGRDNSRHDRCDRRSDVDLDRKSDGIDLDIDLDMRGNYLRLDIDLGRRDFDLKIDARDLVPDSGPMAALVGGEGNAIGENTLVEADIFGRLLDLGSITAAFGTATFESKAASSDGFAYASAYTFADISGADIVFVFTEKTSMLPSGEQALWATEISRTSYVAIDFEDFDFGGGPLVFNYDDIDLFVVGERSCGCGTSPAPRIEGNVAELTADVLAQAENTHVDVAASILTVEDQLSSVSAMAITAIV